MKITKNANTPDDDVIIGDSETLDRVNKDSDTKLLVEVYPDLEVPNVWMLVESFLQRKFLMEGEYATEPKETVSTLATPMPTGEYSGVFNKQTTITLLNDYSGHTGLVVTWVHPNGSTTSGLTLTVTYPSPFGSVDHYSVYAIDSLGVQSGTATFDISSVEANAPSGTINISLLDPLKWGETDPSMSFSGAVSTVDGESIVYKVTEVLNGSTPVNTTASENQSVSITASDYPEETLSVSVIAYHANYPSAFIGPVTAVRDLVIPLHASMDTAPIIADVSGYTDTEVNLYATNPYPLSTSGYGLHITSLGTYETGVVRIFTSNTFTLVAKLTAGNLYSAFVKDMYGRVTPTSTFTITATEVTAPDISNMSITWAAGPFNTNTNYTLTATGATATMPNQQISYEFYNTTNMSIVVGPSSGFYEGYLTTWKSYIAGTATVYCRCWHVGFPTVLSAPITASRAIDVVVTAPDAGGMSVSMTSPAYTNSVNLPWSVQGATATMSSSVRYVVTSNTNCTVSKTTGISGGESLTYTVTGSAGQTASIACKAYHVDYPGTLSSEWSASVTIQAVAVSETPPNISGATITIEGPIYVNDQDVIYRITGATATMSSPVRYALYTTNNISVSKTTLITDNEALTLDVIGPVGESAYISARAYHLDYPNTLSATFSTQMTISDNAVVATIDRTNQDIVSYDTLNEGGDGKRFSYVGVTSTGDTVHYFVSGVYNGTPVNPTTARTIGQLFYVNDLVYSAARGLDIEVTSYLTNDGPTGPSMSKFTKSFTVEQEVVATIPFTVDQVTWSTTRANVGVENYYTFSTPDDDSLYGIYFTAMTDMQRNGSATGTVYGETKNDFSLYAVPWPTYVTDSYPDGQSGYPTFSDDQPTVSFYIFRLDNVSLKTATRTITLQSNTPDIVSSYVTLSQPRAADMVDFMSISINENVNYDGTHNGSFYNSINEMYHGRLSYSWRTRAWSPGVARSKLAYNPIENSNIINIYGLDATWATTYSFYTEGGKWYTDIVLDVWDGFRSQTIALPLEVTANFKTETYTNKQIADQGYIHLPYYFTVNQDSNYKMTYRLAVYGGTTKISYYPLTTGSKGPPIIRGIRKDGSAAYPMMIVTETAPKTGIVSSNGYYIEDVDGPYSIETIAGQQVVVYTNYIWFEYDMSELSVGPNWDSIIYKSIPKTSAPIDPYSRDYDVDIMANRTTYTSATKIRDVHVNGSTVITDTNDSKYIDMAPWVAEGFNLNTDTLELHTATCTLGANTLVWWGVCDFYYQDSGNTSVYLNNSSTLINISSSDNRYDLREVRFITVFDPTSIHIGFIGSGASVVLYETASIPA